MGTKFQSFTVGAQSELLLTQGQLTRCVWFSVRKTKKQKAKNISFTANHCNTNQHQHQHPNLTMDNLTWKGASPAGGG